jgi:hypothetical protein
MVSTPSYITASSKEKKSRKLLDISGAQAIKPGHFFSGQDDICHKTENDIWYLKLDHIWCYDGIEQLNMPEHPVESLTGKNLAKLDSYAG